MELGTDQRAGGLCFGTACAASSTTPVLAADIFATDVPDLLKSFRPVIRRTLYTLTALPTS